jgi:hypothetical protein
MIVKKLQISWSPNHNRQFSEVPNYLRRDLNCIIKWKERISYQFLNIPWILFTSECRRFSWSSYFHPRFVFGRPRVDFKPRRQLILTDTFDFSPYFLRAMETLRDLRSSYVPEGPAQVQFPQVAVEYTYRQLYIYIQSSRVEIQTVTHRNLTDRSMTATPPCCRPTIFFRHPNLIAFLSWQERIRRSLQKWNYFKLYFYFS